MRQYLVLLVILLLLSVSNSFVLTDIKCSSSNYANIQLNGSNALYSFATNLKNTTTPCAYQITQTCVEETRYATSCDNLNSCSCSTVPQTCSQLTTNWYDVNYPKCRNVQAQSDSYLFTPVSLKYSSIEGNYDDYIERLSYAVDRNIETDWRYSQGGKAWLSFTLTNPVTASAARFYRWGSYMPIGAEFTLKFSSDGANWNSYTFTRDGETQVVEFPSQSVKYVKFETPSSSLFRELQLGAKNELKSIREPLKVNVGDNNVKVVNTLCNNKGSEVPYTANGNDILFYPMSDAYSIYYGGASSNSVSEYFRPDANTLSGELQLHSPVVGMFTEYGGVYVNDKGVQASYNTDQKWFGFGDRSSYAVSNLFDYTPKTSSYTYQHPYYLEHSYKTNAVESRIRVYRGLPIITQWLKGANVDNGLKDNANIVYKTYSYNGKTYNLLNYKDSLNYALMLYRVYNGTVNTYNGVVYHNSEAVTEVTYYFFSSESEYCVNNPLVCDSTKDANKFIDYFERTPVVGEENLLANSYYTLSYDCSTLNCEGTVTTCSETSTPKAYNYTYNISAETISGAEALKDTLCLDSCAMGVFNDSRDYIFLNDTTLFLKVKDYGNDMVLYASAFAKANSSLPYPFYPSSGSKDEDVPVSSDWAPIVSTTALAASVIIAYERRNYLQAYVSSIANTFTTITKKETIFERLQREANIFATTVGAVKTEIKYYGDNDYEFFFTLANGQILSSKEWQLVDLGLKYVTLRNGENYYILKDGKMIELRNEKYVSANNYELFSYSKWQQDLIIFTAEHNDNVALDLSDKNYLFVNGALISMSELDRRRTEYFIALEERKTKQSDEEFTQNDYVPTIESTTVPIVPTDEKYTLELQEEVITLLEQKEKKRFNLWNSLKNINIKNLITGDVQTGGEIAADIGISFIPVIGSIVDFRDLVRGIVVKEERYLVPLSLIGLASEVSVVGDYVTDALRGFIKANRKKSYIQILNKLGVSKIKKMYLYLIERLGKKFSKADLKNTGTYKEIYKEAEEELKIVEKIIEENPNKLEEVLDISKNIGIEKGYALLKNNDLYGINILKKFDGFDKLLSKIAELNKKGFRISVDYNLLYRFDDKALDLMDKILENQNRVSGIAEELSKKFKQNGVINLRFSEQLTGAYAYYNLGGQILIDLPKNLNRIENLEPSKAKGIILELVSHENMHSFTSVLDKDIKDVLGESVGKYLDRDGFDIGVNEAHDLLTLKFAELSGDKVYSKAVKEGYVSRIELSLEKNGILDTLTKNITPERLNELEKQLVGVAENGAVYNSKIPLLAEWLVVKGDDGIKIVDGFIEKLSNSQIHTDLSKIVKEAKTLAKNYERVIDLVK